MREEIQQKVFKDWLNSYRSLLFKVVRAYADSADDQDDLFQEISIQVWRSIPNFREQSAVSTWLYRIAINTSLNSKRKEKRHYEGRHGIDDIPHLLQANTAYQDDRLDWLYEEISVLKPIDKSLALLLLDDYSYKEMAAILGLSESNVGVRINRIKKHLIARSENIKTHGN
ncbi:MAG: RNA polymerase sigma factor [Cyclobacteriaceae bacterium]